MNNQLREKSLLELMEYNRQKMISFGEKYGLTNPKTVQVSQNLDKLMNQYLKK